MSNIVIIPQRLIVTQSGPSVESWIVFNFFVLLKLWLKNERINRRKYYRLIMTIKWNYAISAKGGQTPRKDKVVSAASDWILTVKADGESGTIAKVLGIIAGKTLGIAERTSVTISVLSETKEPLELAIKEMAPEISKVAGQPTLDIFPFDTSLEPIEAK